MFSGRHRKGKLPWNELKLISVAITSVELSLTKIGGKSPAKDSNLILIQWGSIMYTIAMVLSVASFTFSSKDNLSTGISSNFTFTVILYLSFICSYISMVSL